MAPTELRGTLNLIRQTIAPPRDAELLARHLLAPQGPAFAELVRRHGPMVFAVCRRLLGNEPDARDAFQETFLRFLGQARSVRRADLLAGWLYRVAANECRRLRARQVIRAAYEESAAQSRPLWAADANEPERREMRRILDEEAERLPEPMRTALVLCDLQGLAQEEAARRVGWPRSTLAFRLERARALLRTRLRRRGYESAADIPGMPIVAVPSALVDATLARAPEIGARLSLRGAIGRTVAVAVIGFALVGTGTMFGPRPAPVPEATAALIVSPAPPRAKEPDEVAKSIGRAIAYLKRVEAGHGHWENSDSPIAAVMKGGWSSLALLALLKAGVPPNDPLVQRGLAWLRQQELHSTYVIGLETAVFARAGIAEDKPRIQKNVDWLVRARSGSGPTFRGWSYDAHPGMRTDNSNSQYALLGLWAAKTAGVNVPAAIWNDIRDYYIRTQQPDGGWCYEPSRAVSTLTMTTAGANGLYLSGLALNSGRQSLRPDTAALDRGLKFVGEHFTVRPRAHAFYNLFGIARLGRNSGRRFFGTHDWFREGRDFLLKSQHPDGSWSVGNGQLTDNWPVVSTSFAVLFLAEAGARGSVPVGGSGTGRPAPGRIQSEAAGNVVGGRADADRPRGGRVPAGGEPDREDRGG